jgi:dienelactone hydrolase
MTLRPTPNSRIWSLVARLIVSASLSSSAYAGCERQPYAFEAPDQYIKVLKSQMTPALGTVLLSHGGTGGRAGPLSSGWAKFLSDNGYDAVVLNHFPQRGVVGPNCKATYPEADAWRREDALAVIRWLARESTPASSKIFLMGFSAGTASVFPFITDSRFKSDLPSPDRIAGGILFYPWSYGCMNPPADLTKRTLFVGATEDNVMRCWESSSWLRSGQGSGLLTVNVIEGAFHAFDNPSVKIKKCSEGGRYPYCMEYNADAHKRAEQLVLEFLNGAKN